MSELPDVDNLGRKRVEPQVVVDQLRQLRAGDPSSPRLSQQEASRRNWRYRLRMLGEDGPSWLFSLIVHFLVFLLVTSFAVPWTPDGNAGKGTIALTLGFLPDDEAGGEAERITLAPGELTEDQVGERASAPAEPVPEPNDATAPPAPAQPPEPTSDNQPEAASAAATAARSPSTPSAAGTRMSERASEMQVSPYAAILDRNMLRQARSSSARPTAAPQQDAFALVVPPLTEPYEDARQQNYDEVVDDFIEYDVGRLRGSAGQKARDRFAALGPESFPALIRGLNKAAGIHASCPVGVIAGKVLTTLRASNDPGLRDYALSHIGVGVAETAPHYERLMAMRKHWLNGPALPPKVAAVIDRLETRQEGELMELMLALSDAPADTLSSSLTSGDDYLAAAATLALIQGNRTWTMDQRAKLRAALIRFRSTTGNAQLRELADDANRRLRR